jgi:ABC-type transporter Mla subunit MlaD
MMRRFAIAALLVVVAVALAAASSDEAGSEGRRYVVQLNNAFGMVEEGDVRVAGTNAGKIKKIRLDERTTKALVEIELTEDGYGTFRKDAECETRPQSPLGEYYMDCKPGSDPQELPEGARITNTASTIPPDLITNIMRRPFRERFRLILAELGAGLAGRPQELNDAIRRAVPALRQSANLLAILADENQTIKRLVRDADEVIGKLADNRRDVGRFVGEAEDTASASAERAVDLQENWRQLPGFLTELTPTMEKLEEVAREQRPVLVDLSASATNLTRFLDLGAEFSDAQRPALRALADAAPIGRQALRATTPRIRELRDYAGPNVDLAKNLAITLEDFDDRDRAVEKHPLSPGGKGFSGTEALLQYVFSQAVQTNAFDELGHLSRVSLIQSKCGPLVNAEDYKRRQSDDDKSNDLADCRAWLGPNQPGITTPDPTAEPGQTGAPPASGDDNPSAARSGVTPDKGSPGGSGSGTRSGARSGGAASALDRVPPEIRREIERVLDQMAQNGRSDAPDPTQLLDYLLAP